MKYPENNDDTIESAINWDEYPSVDRRWTSSTMPLKDRKSACMQAAVFSDATKERSLSVTTQMLGKLQDGEIKRFLTGLGNLTKSYELPTIENSSIPRTAYFKENDALKCHSTSNAITSQDTYNSIDHGNVDTILIAKQTKRTKAKHFIDKSCAV